MNPITLEMVRDKWRACYPADRLAALYPVPHTPEEVLTLREGPWSEVPDKDRIWTLTRSGALPDRIQRLFACDCAERALAREREAGREPDARSWNAIAVARKYADGQATGEELDAAWRAAYAAYAAYAADAAAHAAAYAAADAAYTAAAAAAADAAYAAAAAYTAAAAAYARSWQVSHLLQLVKENPCE